MNRSRLRIVTTPPLEPPGETEHRRKLELARVALEAGWLAAACIALMLWGATLYALAS